MWIACRTRFTVCLFVAVSLLVTRSPMRAAEDVKARYAKSEHMVPMRDGVRLMTIVYAPKQTDQEYAILLLRTPYSIAPYGADEYRSSLGPSKLFADDG